MRTIIEYFSRNHTFAYLTTFMFLLIGVSTVFTIKRDTFPAFDLGVLTVLTQYPGASAEDVELSITNKLEKELKTLTGIDYITSLSMDNVSSISVTLDPNIKKPDKVKQNIRDAVGRVTDLPPEIPQSAWITEIEASGLPIIEVGVTGDIPYKELRRISTQLEKDLEQVPGVAKIDRVGYLNREILVEIDPNSINQYNISLRDAINAIKLRNLRLTAGNIKSGSFETSLVTHSEFETPMAVSDVIIRSSPGGIITRIKDIAQIKDGFEKNQITPHLNGKPTIALSIRKSEEADNIRVCNKIKEKIAEINKTLPENVEILFANDESTTVKNSFGIVLWNGIIGFSLVILILRLFMNLTLSIWVAMGIPFTFMGAIFLLPFFDSFLDTITLTSMIIVLGIIVDDAIIVSDSIYSRWQDGESPEQAAIEGTYQVWRPVLTTIATTLCAFAPMFFVSGTMGKFIYVIPLTVSLALIVSIIEALVVLPSHLSSSLKRTSRTLSTPSLWFENLRKSYQHLLTRLLRWRYLLILLFMFTFYGVFQIGKHNLDVILFPSEMAKQFFIIIELPDGSNLKKTTEMTKKVEKMILDLEPGEIESFTTRIGGTYEANLFPTFGKDQAFIRVNLPIYSKQLRSASEIVEQLRNQTKLISGIKKISYKIESGGPDVGRPITIRIVGTNDTMRMSLSNAIVAYLEQIKGVRDIERNDLSEKKQVRAVIDHQALARLGLNATDIALNLRTAYTGEIVTKVRYEDEEVDFRVSCESKAIENLNTVRNLLIPNARGDLIKLGTVVEFIPAEGTPDYYHYNGNRAVIITADVDLNTVTPLEATNQVINQFDIKSNWPGMQLLIGGEAEETNQSLQSLAVTMIIAVVGIYFLLILLFRSFLQPFLVISAIPFSILGVIIAYLLHGTPLSFTGMLGVIGLAGVVVNDSLVMVDHLNELRLASPQADLIKLVAQGSANRFRAIIMTTLTTVAGVTPTVYGLGGTDPFMAPMALSLGYGLVFATPLILFLVPCSYMVYVDIINKFQRKSKNS